MSGKLNGGIVSFNFQVRCPVMSNANYNFTGTQSPTETEYIRGPKENSCDPLFFKLSIPSSLGPGVHYQRCNIL